MDTGLFSPSKRNGLLFHGSLLAALAVISTWGFVNLSHTTIGENFVTYLLVGLIAFAPIPWIGYRAYALLRAEYVLNRDGLELRWGLRDEAIPLNDIEWVRPVHDLTHRLRLPSMSVPGAILGLRRHPDLGVVEFIASDRKNLLLVATAKRVFAISPARPLDFTQTFAACHRTRQHHSCRAKIALSVFHHRTSLGKRMDKIFMAGLAISEISACSYGSV